MKSILYPLFFLYLLIHTLSGKEAHLEDFGQLPLEIKHHIVQFLVPNKSFWDELGKKPLSHTLTKEEWEKAKGLSWNDVKAAHRLSLSCKSFHSMMKETHLGSRVLAYNIFEELGSIKFKDINDVSLRYSEKVQSFISFLSNHWLNLYSHSSPLKKIADKKEHKSKLFKQGIQNFISFQKLQIESDKLFSKYRYNPKVYKKNEDGSIYLNLSLYNLPMVPSQVFTSLHLKLLNLSHNNLFMLNSELRDLTELEGIFAMHNYLTTLPEDIETLDNLRVLFLFDNPFSNKTQNRLMILNNRPTIEIYFTQRAMGGEF